MLRRNSGYFLAEVLLSLTVWLLITGLLLPLVIQLKSQSVLLALDNTAVHLLFDELENKMDQSLLTGNKTIMSNGTAFEIVWYEDMSETKVCVEYKDGFSNTKKQCRRPE